jgi:hypothetical protein
MRTARLPVVDWTDAPADLNRLVRFVERQNLVSARVPSHFKRSLLLWTSDQPVAETSAWQHTTQHNRQTSMSPGGIRTHILSRQVAADLRLRRRGHWDRLLFVIQIYNCHWRYTKQLLIYYKNAWTQINYLFLYFINVTMFCAVTVGHTSYCRKKATLPYLSRFKVKKIHVECNLTVTDLSLGTALTL